MICDNYLVGTAAPKQNQNSAMRKHREQPRSANRFEYISPSSAALARPARGGHALTHGPHRGVSTSPSHPRHCCTSALPTSNFQVSTRHHIHTTMQLSDDGTGIKRTGIIGPHRVNTIRRKDQSLPRLGPKLHLATRDRIRAHPRSPTRHPFYIIFINREMA